MKSKTVYQADADGFFLHELPAYELPLEPGKFNVPFGAYADAPAEPAAGYIAKRTASGWQQVEDHRAATLYVVSTGSSYSIGSTIELNGAKVRYDGGGPVPNWLTTTAPVKQAAGASS
ncbi:phage tail protein [Burkholderia cenocepacia]|uniref:phage tail protein n=1 Tax=Burkholderia cenocepacia TaxID=95486 RepID=UPI001AA19BF5|nr:phage tail protein [Burkholderia cenocepacia]MBO1856861.1 phage tail protein [Burkholderia cenocepacia]